jgi:hypothetical protein
VQVKITSYLSSASTGEKISEELAAVLDFNQSTVSHHLGQLPKAGW